MAAVQYGGTGMVLSRYTVTCFMVGKEEDIVFESSVCGA